MRAFASGIVLVSMLAAGTAQGAMTASAELSSWNLTLIDLDPNDGVTPSITWTGPLSGSSGWSKVDVSIGDSNADWTFDSTRFGYSQQPHSYEYSIFRGSSGGSMNGDPENMQMRSWVEFVGADGAWNKTKNSVGSGYLPFVLSPMTTLTVSADVLMTAPPTDLPYVVHALSTASGQLFVDGRWVNGVSFDSANYGGVPSLTKTLSYTLTNGTAATEDHQLFVSVASGISANFSIAAVPEPSTWGMLLLGAATIGAVARRRQRR